MPYLTLNRKREYTISTQILTCYLSDFKFLEITKKEHETLNNLQ